MEARELLKTYFDWAGENYEKNNPNMLAVYSYIVDLSESKNVPFGFESCKAMHYTAIKSYKTYRKHLLELEKNGFIKVIKRPANQHSNWTIKLTTQSLTGKELEIK